VVLKRRGGAAARFTGKRKEKIMAQSMEGFARRNGAARGALRSRAQDVADDFAELRKDVGRLADAANKAARSEVHHAQMRLDRATQQVRARAQGGVDYMSDKVRTHPGAAIGISLGAGLLIGILLSAAGRR